MSVPPEDASRAYLHTPPEPVSIEAPLQNQLDVATSQAPAILVLAANRAILFVMIVPGLLMGIFLLLGLDTVALALAGIVTIGLFALLFRHHLPALLKDSRVRRAPRPGMAIGLAVLCPLASVGLSAFMASLWPVLPPADMSLEPVGFLGMTYLAAGMVVLTPLYEEFIVRGFALRAYEGVRPRGFVWLFVTLVFALMHGFYWQAITVLPLALVLTLSVIATESLWTAVLVHGLNNFIALSLPYVPYLDQFFVATVPTRAEGLAGLCIAIAATFGAVWWLGTPTDGARRRGKLWSGSLVTAVGLGVIFFVGSFVAERYLGALW